MITNLQDILAHPIADIIGRRVPLQKNKCRCPFHGGGSERSASLTLFPDNHWYCFGCKTGGSSVDFVMQFDKLEFRDAVEVVASEAGIPIQETDNGARRTGPARADLHAAVMSAAIAYAAELPSHPEAVAYCESRGLSKAIRSKWKIGYACGTRVADCGAELTTLVAAGILGIPATGSANLDPYDRLAGRITIPICDPAGRPVAFTGRSLPGNESGPKYVNTPDTPIWDKSATLFGYREALAIHRDAAPSTSPVIVLEGQLKALAAIEAGHAAVSPGGTALTERHAALLARVSNTVHLAFDSLKPDGQRDTAGIAAQISAAKTLRASGLLVKCSRLEIPANAPQGARDPDDLLAAGLPIAFAHCDYWQWCLDSIPTAASGSPEWAAQVSAAVIPAIAHPGADPIMVETEFTLLARAAGLPREALARPTPPPPPELPAPHRDMTPARTLCAIILQLAINPEDPNWWETWIRWTELPAALCSTLRIVATVRARAASHGFTLARSISTCPAARRLSPWLAYWSVAPLPPLQPEAAIEALATDICTGETLKRHARGDI
jgi:DNA primase